MRSDRSKLVPVLFLDKRGPARYSSAEGNPRLAAREASLAHENPIVYPKVVGNLSRGNVGLWGSDKRSQHFA